jgi:hypothetical protein
VPEKFAGQRIADPLAAVAQDSQNVQATDSFVASLEILVETRDNILLIYFVDAGSPFKYAAGHAI